MNIEIGKTYRLTELDNCKMVPVIVRKVGEKFVQVHRHDEDAIMAFWVDAHMVRPLDFAFMPGMTVEFDGRRFTYETGYPDGSCTIGSRMGISRPAHNDQLSVWTDAPESQDEDVDEGEDEGEGEDSPAVEPMTRMVCVYMGENERARYFFRESEVDQMLGMVRDIMQLPNSTVSISEIATF